MRLTLLLLLLAAAALTAVPPRLVGPAGDGGKMLARADGSLESYAVLAEGDRQFLARRVSRDRGAAWGDARNLVALPGSGWGGLVVLRDRNGALQFVLMRLRGTGTRIAVDRFIDLWHVRSIEGESRWSEPQRIFEGYVGSIQQIAQLRSRRILIPFAAWIAGRAAGPPTGPNEVTAAYSDDDGATWKLSPSRLTAPVAAGFNGSNYGAVEPSVLEREDGSVWMLMRTQTGYYYESTSPDGREWTPAARSAIRASTGPPFLLRLPDKRVVLFWNHCEMPPRVNRQGVYGGRDALHAAISSDEGRTWRGYREVYRDPFRNETPPKSGDRGTAYPYATAGPDGKILLISGQGERRRALILVDPDWLLETRAAASLDPGLEQWSVFLGVGPASGWWRDRKPGARVVDGALQLASRPGLPPDCAVWNFPMGRSGVVTLKVRGSGGEVALAHRFWDPGDEGGQARAAFRTALPESAGPEWREVRIEWDATAARARILVNGNPAGQLAANHSEERSVSYLRLRSTGGTFAVKDVSAAIVP